MEINEVTKIIKVLNFRNKIKLSLYIIFSLMYKLTGKKFLKKICLNFHEVKYEISIGKGELYTIYHTNLLKDYMPYENFIPADKFVCLDIGANIGSTSLLWNSETKYGKIYAIEPHPMTYLSLIRNIQINKAEQEIFPHQLSIGADDGEMTLFIPEDGTMAMMPGNYSWIGSEITIPSLSLDSFIKKEGLDSIDIMKIDIEGYEVEALKGASKTLKNTKHVVLEYHSLKLKEECIEILKKNGFDIIEKGYLLFCSKS